MRKFDTLASGDQQDIIDYCAQLAVVETNANGFQLATCTTSTTGTLTDFAVAYGSLYCLTASDFAGVSWALVPAWGGDRPIHPPK